MQSKKRMPADEAFAYLQALAPHGLVVDTESMVIGMAGDCNRSATNRASAEAGIIIGSIGTIVARFGATGRAKNSHRRNNPAAHLRRAFISDDTLAIARPCN
jgi:hypothetical protein